MRRLAQAPRGWIAAAGAALLAAGVAVEGPRRAVSHTIAYLDASAQ
jgi:hypothetical protein